MKTFAILAVLASTASAGYTNGYIVKAPSEPVAPDQQGESTGTAGHNHYYSIEARAQPVNPSLQADETEAEGPSEPELQDDNTQGTATDENTSNEEDKAEANTSNEEDKAEANTSNEEDKAKANTSNEEDKAEANTSNDDAVSEGEGGATDKPGMDVKPANNSVNNTATGNIAGLLGAAAVISVTLF